MGPGVRRRFVEARRVRWGQGGFHVSLLFALPAAAFSLGAAGDGYTIAPMLEKVTPAVVNIAVRSHTTVHNPLLQDPFFRQFFNMPDVPQERVQMSAGSGVIIDAGRGLVVAGDLRHLDALLVGPFRDFQQQAVRGRRDPERRNCFLHRLHFGL